MRTGGVAQSYLDPLAVRIQSIRMGSRGRGWRRFLVFAELTKNKKGAEYIALFCHYSFEAWLRIIFAEGPRNAINAMTLYSVMQANLIPTGDHAASKGQSPIAQFFSNLSTLADSNKTQAAVLFGMLFTLIVWVISFLSLAFACIFYVMFLWHHIPSQDGGLYSYCKRKVDSRLKKIVELKVNKALGQEAVPTKAKDNTNPADRPFELKRQPTLPVLGGAGGDDKLPEMPMLSRQDSEASLPPFISRPPTRNDSSATGLQRAPTLPDVSFDPARQMPPPRSNTQASAASDASFATNAPLIASAGPMGYGPPGRSYSPAPLSRMESDRTMASERSFINRSGTNNSQASFRPEQPPWGPPNKAQDRRPNPPSRQNTVYSEQQPQIGTLTRQNTGMSDYQTYGRSTPLSEQTPGMNESQPYERVPTRQNTGFSDNQSYGRSTPGPPPTRQNTGFSDSQYYGRLTPGPPPTRQNTGMSNYQSRGRSTHTQISPVDSYGRSSPAQKRGTPEAIQQYEMQSQLPAAQQRPPPNGSGYTAYNPNAASGAPSQPMPSISQQPQRDFTPSPTHRNFSAPLHSVRQPPQRSGTAPLPQTATYDDSIYDTYGSDTDGFLRPVMPTRAATAGPEHQYQYRHNASDFV
ncbi:hypothetical protein MMC30_008693 [Trapelia coarctata]|nr:hypothetical protein [Trapelia coarctata]